MYTYFFTILILSIFPIFSAQKYNIFDDLNQTEADVNKEEEKAVCESNVS